jgi:hypothetical protein
VWPLPPDLSLTADVVGHPTRAWTRELERRDLVSAAAMATVTGTVSDELVRTSPQERDTQPEWGYISGYLIEALIADSEGRLSQEAIVEAATGRRGMIVLDEQLLSYGIREPVGRWDRRTVIDITPLRRQIVIRDDAIPMLFRRPRQPTNDLGAPNLLTATPCIAREAGKGSLIHQATGE